MKEAKERLYQKGYDLANQTIGFITLPDQYELYKGDKCVIDHLSEAQVIALSEIL